MSKAESLTVSVEPPFIKLVEDAQRTLGYLNRSEMIKEALLEFFKAKIEVRSNAGL